MRKFIRTISGISLAFIFGFIIFIWALAPPLPPKTNAIIAEVLEADLPEVVGADTAYALSDGLKIWYEVIEPNTPPKGTILLIMGLGGDALDWQTYFYDAFVKAGYRVIRYNNRGTGLSDAVKDWNSDEPYRLDAMANDGLAILDDLNISQAHILGISMGGMIGQTIAIDYPERALTLTSIMSTAYIDDPELPKANMKLFAQIGALWMRYGFGLTEESELKIRVAARNVLAAQTLSPERIKIVAENALYNLRRRRKSSREVLRQHTAAITESGSRIDALRQLNTPSLVIHGKADPLIPFAHGVKSAELIPNAQKLWIDDMGHELHIEHAELVTTTVLEFIEKHEALQKQNLARLN
jgi:pimeloyl-ACP methyl ester carboxylesterase